jgi:hypothetical protein
MLVAGTGLAAAGGSVAVSNAAGLRAVLTLTPSKTFVGQIVVAGIARSTLANGTSVKRLTINWGDGRTVRLGGLKSLSTHRYAHPGRFIVIEALTDSKGHTAHSSMPAVIAKPSRVFWDLFNGRAGTQIQLESAALPLLASSRDVQITGSATNKLRCTAGMTTDSKGRLWVLSYPNGCSAPFEATIQVFSTPVVQSSAPVLTFTLPGTGDVDNLTFDHKGNLWVEDDYNSAVYEFSGPFTTSSTLVPALTITAGINRPSGIAVDAKGDVFVANVTSAGTHSIAVFHAPVSAATVPTFLSGLTEPGGLTVDTLGNLYASSNPANGKGAAVVRYNANHLGNGATPSIVDRWVHLGIPYTSDFAWDALGNLYVADCGSLGGLRVFPLATSPFSPVLRPSAVYTNPSLVLTGCAWGIAIH